VAQTEAYFRLREGLKPLVKSQIADQGFDLALNPRMQGPKALTTMNEFAGRRGFSRGVSARLMACPWVCPWS
jgi:hypothetical protein